MRKSDIVPAIIGSALGLILFGYALVYAPMRANYDQCGRVTLCAEEQSNAD